MKYKNQTTYHVHNFRRGIIGDWKLHLVNEHLEILKGQSFDNFLQVFGYENIEYLDQVNYTPFQQIVRDHIRNGRVYRAELDADLFTFAFNKSNFRSSKYDFVSFSGENGVEIERSSIKDENLLRGFMKATETSAGRCPNRIGRNSSQVSLMNSHLSLAFVEYRSDSVCRNSKKALPRATKKDSSTST